MVHATIPWSSDSANGEGLATAPLLFNLVFLPFLFPLLRCLPQCCWSTSTGRTSEQTVCIGNSGGTAAAAAAAFAVRPTLLRGGRHRTSA